MMPPSCTGSVQFGGSSGPSAANGRHFQTSPACGPMTGSVDPPAGEDDAGHHGFARGLLDDQPNAGLRTRIDHLNLVASLEFGHALADQNGGGTRIGDELLGVGIVNVLAVDPHPHPDHALVLA